MSSYPTTTLLPPYPPRIDPWVVDIPESDEQLYIYYTYINNYLDRLWESYLLYCTFVRVPESTKIFAILFREMDFYEIINQRIVNKMSKHFRIHMYDICDV